MTGKKVHNMHADGLWWCVATKNTENWTAITQNYINALSGYKTKIITILNKH